MLEMELSFDMTQKDKKHLLNLIADYTFKECNFQADQSNLEKALAVDTAYDLMCRFIELLPVTKEYI